MSNKRLKRLFQVSIVVAISGSISFILMKRESPTINITKANPVQVEQNKVVSKLPFRKKINNRTHDKNSKKLKVLPLDQERWDSLKPQERQQYRRRILSDYYGFIIGQLAQGNWQKGYFTADDLARFVKEHLKEHEKGYVDIILGNEYLGRPTNYDSAEGYLSSTLTNERYTDMNPQNATSYEILNEMLNKIQPDEDSRFFDEMDLQDFLHTGLKIRDLLVKEGLDPSEKNQRQMLNKAQENLRPFLEINGEITVNGGGDYLYYLNRSLLYPETFKTEMDKLRALLTSSQLEEVLSDHYLYTIFTSIDHSRFNVFNDSGVEVFNGRVKFFYDSLGYSDTSSLIEHPEDFNSLGNLYDEMRTQNNDSGEKFNELINDIKGRYDASPAKVLLDFQKLQSQGISNGQIWEFLDALYGKQNNATMRANSPDQAGHIDRAMSVKKHLQGFTPVPFKENKNRRVAVLAALVLGTVVHWYIDSDSQSQTSPLPAPVPAQVKPDSPNWNPDVDQRRWNEEDMKPEISDEDIKEWETLSPEKRDEYRKMVLSAFFWQALNHLTKGDWVKRWTGKNIAAVLRDAFQDDFNPAFVNIITKKEDVGNHNSFGALTFVDFRTEGLLDNPDKRDGFIAAINTLYKSFNEEDFSKQINAEVFNRILAFSSYLRISAEQQGLLPTREVLEQKLGEAQAGLDEWIGNDTMDNLNLGERILFWRDYTEDPHLLKQRLDALDQYLGPDIAEGLYGDHFMVQIIGNSLNASADNARLLIGNDPQGFVDDMEGLKDYVNWNRINGILNKAGDFNQLRDLYHDMGTQFGGLVDAVKERYPTEDHEQILVDIQRLRLQGMNNEAIWSYIDQKVRINEEEESRKNKRADEAMNTISRNNRRHFLKAVAFGALGSLALVSDLSDNTGTSNPEGLTLMQRFENARKVVQTELERIKATRQIPTYFYDQNYWSNLFLSKGLEGYHFVEQDVKYFIYLAKKEEDQPQSYIIEECIKAFNEKNIENFLWSWQLYLEAKLTKSQDLLKRQEGILARSQWLNPKMGELMQETVNLSGEDNAFKDKFFDLHKRWEEINKEWLIPRGYYLYTDIGRVPAGRLFIGLVYQVTPQKRGELKGKSFTIYSANRITKFIKGLDWTSKFETDSFVILIDQEQADIFKKSTFKESKDPSKRLSKIIHMDEKGIDTFLNEEFFRHELSHMWFLVNNVSLKENPQSLFSIPTDDLRQFNWDRVRDEVFAYSMQTIVSPIPLWNLNDLEEQFKLKQGEIYIVSRFIFEDLRRRYKYGLKEVWKMSTEEFDKFMDFLFERPDIKKKFKEILEDHFISSDSEEFIQELIRIGLLNNGQIDRRNLDRAMKTEEIGDSAQLVQDLAMKARGGIDFNTDKMNLRTRNEGEEIKFNVDPDMLQQLQNATGFVPVIINIQPLTSISDFLGISHKKL